MYVKIAIHLCLRAFSPKVMKGAALLQTGYFK